MLYRAFEEHVDPKTYDGCTACLINQTAEALGWNKSGTGYRPWFPTVHYLADRFSVDFEPLHRLYNDVCEDKYAQNYAAAMRMAKERLGL